MVAQVVNLAQTTINNEVILHLPIARNCTVEAKTKENRLQAKIP